MLLNRTTSGSRWRTRPDGPGKVTGGLSYLTDLSLPGMLHGLVLRSPHPHAAIVSIDASKAMALPGVLAVLTYADVPGLNRFGIARPDQPVFCEDRVRYIGDAVAAVAAETPEIAVLALRAIEVAYEPLPVVDDPERALLPDSPLVHPEGNVLHRNDYRTADVAPGFAAAAHIVEETYVTPRQMHTYMETEGGLFVPEADGRLAVYSATQHGFMDRMQLARILGRPEADIRVVSSPIGGSFGGKDELNVQPYGALLALATGKPVKVHHSRWESVRAGLKRHPMKIRMKTGVDANGRLLAHEVEIVADKGPYATLGAEVLNFAVEHVIGPYRYDAVDVKSVNVYTNNGMSGEFRGFGGNQAIFALEGQMDRLADKLGMDPWAFRRLNLRKTDDAGPLGQPIAVTAGASQVWEALAESELWRSGTGRGSAGSGPGIGATGGKSAGHDGSGEEGIGLAAARVEAKTASDRGQATAGTPAPPWIRRGVGASFVMHGAGLGVGIPDPAGGRLRLAADGKIDAVFGYEEFGQGLIASLEQMLIEQFGFAAEDVRIVIGDTDVVPDSGSSTASRSTSMMWQSLRRLRGPFAGKLIAAASAALAMPADRLRVGAGGIRDADGGELLLPYAALAAATAKAPVIAETRFEFPRSPVDRVGAHFLYTYSAVAVAVEVNLLTGRVRVADQYHTVAAGPVVNPQGFLGQIEGGSGMALGFSLTEDAVMSGGHYLTENLDTYLIPTVAELGGTFEVEPIETLPEGDEYGPRGIGEVGSVGLAPAIASAVYRAVGKRVNRLPIDPALLQETDGWY
ncbi:molybdopterin cofactor-binding domain-containing protein [Cohnella nanjingensis]|uniref:Molybdopterin-dependent oxidoreductase n=1 Tax=Cohnella nanjingensis TaxID=1387779 RepID=A0A7X0VIQ6_9BACL|nr:molybdopterin cofactor-binding domain-containing protein [Cohnella nanjingensis]MBB6675457.1 molybdopterin-dependent oxidoreductase [Cohnella nanjingensis]